MDRGGHRGVQGAYGIKAKSKRGGRKLRFDTTGQMRRCVVCRQKLSKEDRIFIDGAFYCRDTCGNDRLLEKEEVK